MKIIILCPNSNGLIKDAELYKIVFLKNNFIVDIVIIDDPNKGISVNKNDIILFLELLYEQYINIKCKLKLFMPNHELYDELKYKYPKKLSLIDIVLCKSLISKDIFEIIKKTHKLKCIILYTKFSTYISKDIRDIIKLNNVKKDSNLFVVLAGKSPFKNVHLVIYNWISNNCYLDINKNIKLKITCKKSCFKNLISDLQEYNKINFYDYFKLTDNNYNYKNITIYYDDIDDNIYNNLILTSKFAICISNKEGYGHYINEARYFNTFVITVNHPPMNELIKNNINGLLVDKLSYYRKSSKCIKYDLYNVYPDNDELTEKILYCIKHNDMIFNSKKYYDEDLNYFMDTIKNDLVPFLIKQ